ncbi:UDP-N-acetylmuramate dehydrogenase [Dactylosporangium sp. CA-139066]|uniref:UDP-N-acetylmuramate dehydrogenase n=1 Tax=Dactylosporangium sp. CA-139066 TaxID=3239930 RepID=UPI003D8A8F1F
MSITFADLTTMRVGGPIGRLHVATAAEHAVELFRDADGAGEPLLVMGGGSNLVVGDVGWDGTVVRMASDTVEVDGTTITAAAGVEWDRLVALAVEQGLAGIELLSGIPGSVGGTPVQNVGAYGTETSDVLEAVTVYDRETGAVERWGRDRCGFGSHRMSVFKRSDRWAVLDVTYRLRRGEQSGPIKDPVIAERLGIEKGGTAALADVRAAVVAQRRSKKMVLDADDHDTWSVGSFFINPVMPDGEIPAAAAECPSKPDVPGKTKLHAAWLIQHAGFNPGYGLDWGNGTVALSSRHTLAVTNRGGATTADVMKFAAHIRDGVAAKYQIRLNPECDLINCSY